MNIEFDRKSWYYGNYSEPCKIAFCECLHSDRIAILYGEVTTSQHTEKLLNVLLNLGYKIDTDWKPVRIELYSDELGYLDIHPFVLASIISAGMA